MTKSIRKFFQFKHSPQLLLTSVLLFAIVFSIVRLILAATPDPGHPWSQLGDGNFAVTGQTAPRTYTLPDASATILTSNSLVSVAQGGTGTSSLTGILVGNGTGALTPTTTPTGDWLIGTNATSNMSNKTINLSDNTLTVNSIATGDLLKGFSTQTILKLARGSAGQFLRANAAGSALEYANVGVPTGSDTQIQYNNAGSFGASSNLTWNQSTKSLALNGSLALGTSSVPTAGTTGTIKIFNQSLAGRNMLSTRSDDSEDFGALQPSIYSNFVTIYGTNNGGNALTFIGDRYLFSNVGTASQADDVSEDFGMTLLNGTGATLANLVAVGTTDAMLYRGSAAGRNGYFFFTRFGTYTNVSSVAFWVGLTDQAASTILGADNPAGDRSGFAFSTALGESNWMVSNKDGTTEDRYSTGMAVATDKMYDFYLYTPPQGTSVTWRIDNLTDGTTVEGSSSSNLPTAATAMRAVAGVRTITTASKFFRFQKMYIEVPK